jgi:hypothetical protein
MQRYQWEWRGGTNVDSIQERFPVEIDVYDRRHGEKVAVTNCVEHAERITSALNYQASLATP